MTADEVVRVHLFLSIAMLLLPLLWVLLAFQTDWLRTTLKTATVQWMRNGGKRRSKGNLRVTLWSVAATVCFAYGGFAQALALVAILNGWETTEKLAAELLLYAVIVSIALSVWVLLLRVAPRVHLDATDDETS